MSECAIFKTAYEAACEALGVKPLPLLQSTLMQSPSWISLSRWLSTATASVRRLATVKRPGVTHFMETGMPMEPMVMSEVGTIWK